MLVGEAKSRIQSKFEGGSSISADWYLVLKEAGEALLERINPHTLQRIQELYGGLAGNIVRYYCPPDVHVPSKIVDLRDRSIYWSYVSPQEFHEKQQDYKFTIEYQNGLPFILARQSNVASVLSVDDFESVGGKTGVALKSNTFNYLNGSGSLQGTFTDTITDVEETLATAIDISEYKEGIAVVPLNFEDADKVASVKLQLITDASNYYEMTSSGTVIDDNFVDGWNIVRFSLQDAIATGSPTDTNITAYKLSITMKTGESQTIIIDSIKLHKSVMYHFGYYSNLLFVDKDNGAWKENAEHDDDKINLGRREAGLLIYEACRVVSFQSTKLKARAKEDFAVVLGEKYNTYWENSPSEEAPLSYNQENYDSSNLFRFRI